ncbi:MAG: thiamine pyrophosphate-dependent dehydrogenase E1 component subunit alpha [Spirochaetes bacterium]|nr:thiamine pyrophosphate-dependent dehydrogenase E1 component subunit alpha [Spirochaetota bacterium]
MNLSIDKKTAVELFRTMVKIRRFDETVIQLYADGEIPGFMHLYIGEEAVAAGVCAALNKSDYITSTHRGHGHCIAKGGRPDYMMAELFGRKTGYCKGKGGSMHIADLDIGILGANGIVSGGIPTAVGAAVGIQYQDDDRVAVSFFGDGATNVGQFHEACNLASIWELPVIFVCENNLFAQTTPRTEHQKIKDVAARASAYDMPAVTVDGNDVIEVYQASKEAVKRARDGGGPTFIECKTYRWRGHWEGDPQPYRTQDEVKEWKLKCPITRFRRYLIENKVMLKQDLESIDKIIEDELQKAVEFARISPFPEPEEALDDVYTI